MLALFHSEVIIDREALRRWLPLATGRALSETQGGEAERWQAAYRQVQADWDSYWADLTLDDDDSLTQWREGHFRVVRAVFRLAGREMPPADRMTWCVDDLPRMVGRHCQALKKEGADTFRALHGKGIAVGIVAPALSSSLMHGMLEAAALSDIVRKVLGPDEIGQVGLDGITGGWLADLAGVPADKIQLISPVSVRGLTTLAPPAVLHILPELISSREHKA